MIAGFPKTDEFKVAGRGGSHRSHKSKKSHKKSHKSHKKSHKRC